MNFHKFGNISDNGANNNAAGVKNKGGCKQGLILGQLQQTYAR